MQGFLGKQKKDVKRTLSGVNGYPQNTFKKPALTGWLFLWARIMGCVGLRFLGLLLGCYAALSALG